MTGMRVSPFGWSPGRDSWSREASKRLFPPAARAYWGECDVEWVPPADRLDTHYGTDAFVRGASAHASVALRLRSHSHWRRFGDITFRHDSLQTPGKLLETASATAGVYWCGFANTDCPEPPTDTVDWYLLRLQGALDALRTGRLRFRGPFANADESSRLIAVTVADLQRLGLILSSQAAPPPPAKPEPPVEVATQVQLRLEGV